ncbi:Ig-like domain-containing protein [Leifsonia poae]|uniref:Uncharacterized protein n=1 Tax=Leifsonia poae TaxID=110933 RepID=A0A9W6HC25_9MICO|nr:Ig-like domain-containing protein [Leifsonia poae]GLJ77350.1 hypothetical protein GCM10017584_29240 [Leifsonia poae]
MGVAKRVGVAALVMAVVALGVSVPLSAQAAQAPAGAAGAQWTNGVATFPGGVTVTLSALGSMGPFAGGGSLAPRGGTYAPTGILNADQTRTAFVPSGATDDVYRPVGIVTYTFSRPVTNPSIHFTNLNGSPAAGSTPTMFASSTLRLDLQGGLTMTPTAGWTGWRVGSTSIVADNPAATAGGGAPACTSPLGPNTSPQGCGSVQVSGTVTQVTFGVSLARHAEGGATPSTASAFYYTTVSADEDGSNLGDTYGAASALRSDVAIGPSTSNDNAEILNTTAVAAPSSTNDGTPAWPALSTALAGQAYTATVPVSNAAGGPTKTASTLAGWIDFNGDGVFGADEQATAVVPAGAATADLTWTVPAGVVSQVANARLRIGYDSAQSTVPAGMSDSGEIEDSTLRITLTPVTISSPTNGSTVTTATPVITGTGEPGQIVTVTDETGATLGTPTVGVDGSWTLTPATGLSNGPHTITATQGTGTTATSESTAITVAIPAPIQITSPADGSTIATDTPTITGTATPSSTVTVTDETGAVLGTTTVLADGTWSLISTALSSGPHAITATDSDGSTAVVDITVNGPLGIAPVTITAPADGASTTDRTPTFAGTGEPGATITITDEAGAVVGSATVASDGTWTVVPVVALTAGPHEFTVTQTVGTDTTVAVVALTITTPAGPTPPISPAPPTTSGGASGDGGLAATGSDIALPAGLAILTIFCGVGVLLNRRRSASRGA